MKCHSGDAESGHESITVHMMQALKDFQEWDDTLTAFVMAEIISVNAQESNKSLKRWDGASSVQNVSVYV
jgi:hypothetical protein